MAAWVVDEPNVGPTGKTKPRMRGVSHQYAFFTALGAGLVLVAMAGPGRAAIGAAVFAASAAWGLGVSALYHRPMWRLDIRAHLRRLDHASIFILISGTYTPFCLMALPEAQGNRLLVIVWVGALVGMAQALFWIRRPRAIGAALYLALGWLAVAYQAEFRASLGFATVALVGAGGLLYSIGAVVYALRRPNPAPRVFGYHEVFHVFVVLACGLHFVAVMRVVRGT